jgi:hypothetical protein
MQYGLLFLCILFVPILHATEQIPDNLLYKGELYKLTQYRGGFGSYESWLSSYIRKDKDKWKWITPGSTALWRGYIATFEIANNELVLKDMEIQKGIRERESILNKFLSVSETKDSIFKINWYTGTVFLAGGRALPGGRLYGSWDVYHIHEHHLFLEFEKGILKKERRMDYMEYLAYIKEKEWISPLITPFQERFMLDYQRTLEDLEHYTATKNGELASRLIMKSLMGHGEPISDFELKTEKISFTEFLSPKPHYSPIPYNITVTRTAKGARAKYRHEYHFYIPEEREIELSMEEWQDFIRAIYRCRTDEWEKNYGEWNYENNWKFQIYSSGNDKPDEFRGDSPVYPPNWAEFKKIIDDMEVKIRRDSAAIALETKLQAEHEKIYGVPITDFERSLRFVRFKTSELGRGFDFKITRTATGALAEYNLEGYSVKKPEKLSVELSVEEWFSFVKAINKCNVGKWEKYYIKVWKNEKMFEWHTEIFFTDRRGLVTQGDFAYPQNWNAFKKALNGIEEKMRKNLLYSPI